ncbi:MAG TPA: Hpt domain-containing protein, partial [Candidatus Wallbacteria bacterium]|nr:Hpt domain-containing protein [Candidatus Wallbacteria bacterium]
MTVNDDEKQEYMQEFIHSSRELLDDVEPQIIALEKTAVYSGKVDEEILNTIFRLFHTLKGTAAFVDLQTITSVTHEAETLLDIFRKGSVALESEHVDLLCRTSDFIRNILDTVEKQLDDKIYDGIAQEIVTDLKQTIISIAPEQLPRNEYGKPFAYEPPVEKKDEPAENTSQNIPEDMQLIITPEMKTRFAQESYELCEEAEIMLLAFEKASHKTELAANAFRALHSIKGNAGFFGYADMEKISHMAETVLDGLRNNQRMPDKDTIFGLLAAIDFLKNSAKIVTNGTRISDAETQKVIAVIQKIIDAPLKTKTEIESAQAIAKSAIESQIAGSVQPVKSVKDNTDKKTPAALETQAKPFS